MGSIGDSFQQYFGKFLTPVNSYEVAGFLFTPSYVQAAAIIGLLFLLVLTLARLRKLYVGWSLGRSGMAMMFWGFLLAVVLEGFLLLGGRTFFTEVLGWKNPPKPIAKMLDASREKLVDVLGITQEIPESTADEPATIESVIGQFQSLPPDEAEQLKKIICTP